MVRLPGPPAGATEAEGEATYALLVEHVANRAHDFDVLHFHTEVVHFPLFEDVAEKTLTTLHGRLDLKDLPGVYRRWPQFPLVSISDSQRAPRWPLMEAITASRWAARKSLGSVPWRKMTAA